MMECSSLLFLGFHLSLKQGEDRKQIKWLKVKVLPWETLTIFCTLVRLSTKKREALLAQFQEQMHLWPILREQPVVSVVWS